MEAYYGGDNFVLITDVNIMEMRGLQMYNIVRKSFYRCRNQIEGADIDNVKRYLNGIIQKCSTALDHYKRMKK